MKRIFTLTFSLLVLFCTSAMAQNAIQAGGRQYSIPNRNHTKSSPIFNGLNKTSTCSADTIEYTIYKATGLNTININSTTSAGTGYQWFPAPQAITVSGFNFFAFLSSLAGIQSQSVTLSIYNAGIDSMPSGAALRSITMNIDTVLGNGSLGAILKRAIFTTPATITNPNGYVIAIENTSGNQLNVLANDWNNLDGGSEWCASVRIGTNNIRSYNISIAGTPYDADFIMFPIVTYSLTADFTYTPACFTPGNPVSFTNTSSAINNSRFYNLRKLFGVYPETYTWDFGNSTGGNAVDTNVVYTTGGTYNVKLTDSIEGYYRYCTDNKSLNISSSAPAPNAGGGGSYCIGSTLSLTCATVAGSTYYWTGPNGYTSTAQNPSRTSFSSLMAGQYDVMTINGTCSSAVASVIVAAILPPVATSNTPVCFGQTLNLTASLVPGGTYAWTGPNGFTSSAQSPNRTNLTAADTGLYTLNVSLPGCSFNPVTTRVAGLAKPATPTVGNAQSLCEGEGLSLSAQGTYVNPTFNWNGPNNYSSNTQNPSISATTLSNSGTYSVTVTVNGCTSSSASTNVAINPKPSAPTVGSNGALCAGQTLSLSASAIANATYNWSGPNNFTSTQQNPSRISMTTADAGLYSVIATVNGCSSVSASITISVSASAPSPTASSNSPVCAGQSLTLFASNVAGANYSWTGPNGFTSNAQNPVITNVTSAGAGTYSVTAATATCGTSPASTVNVTINALTITPIASNAGPACEGSSTSLSITTINGATYGWVGPNAYVSASQNPNLNNVTKAMAGTYTVTISTSQCGAVGSYSTILAVKQKPVVTSVFNNSPLCAGDTLQVSVNGTNTSSSATFAWTGPNSYASSGKSIVINNVSSANDGTYSVTATDSGCTSASFSTGFIVKPKPTAPVSSNSSPQCEGTKLDLTASLISNATYVWSGPNNFTSTQRNPSINAIAKAGEGTYKVYCVVNGCKSVEEATNVVINIKPASPVISNNSPYCERSNVSLTVPAVSGATYSWTGPVNFTSTNQNVSLISAIPVQSGTYSCVMTVAGCVSDAGTTELVVTPLPTAPTLSSFPVNKLCAGDSLQLFASFTDLATYSWTGPAGFVSALRNPTIKNTNQAYSGTYSVAITKGACTSQPANITITVNPTPNTGNISGLANVFKLDTVSYMVNGLQGSSFDWNVTGANITLGAGSNKVQVKWLTVGTETIKVKETSDQGCLGVEKSFAVNVAPTTGVNELQTNADVIVYPNPMNETLTVSMLGNHKLQSAILYDLVGNEIITSNKSEIIVSHLQSGIYVIRVIDNNGNTYTQKIVKN